MKKLYKWFLIVIDFFVSVCKYTVNSRVFLKLLILKGIYKK